jgi:inner membrane protein
MLISADPLAHAGLTVLVAFVIQQLFMWRTASSARARSKAMAPVGAEEPREYPPSPRTWRLDYRLVIIGSLLPDIIDRPLGLWLLPDVFGPSTRALGHTLLFNALFVMVALAALRVGGYRAPLVLALASSGHLLIDMMWEVPQTLFWPLYGIGFGRAESDYTPDWLQWLRTDTCWMMVEAFGALVLAIFLARLLWRRRFLRWLIRGET